MLQPGLTVGIYIKSKDCMTVWSYLTEALEQLSWDGGRLSVSRARVEGGKLFPSGHLLWDYDRFQRMPVGDSFPAVCEHVLLFVRHTCTQEAVQNWL